MSGMCCVCWLRCMLASSYDAAASRRCEAGHAFGLTQLLAGCTYALPMPSLFFVSKDLNAAADEMIETMMPFATLPEPSNVAVLAAAGGPELAPSLHLGVLAAALCCIVAAANGVRAPASRTEEEG